MWPIRFDLDVDEKFTIRTAANERVVTLLGVKETYWPDYFTNNPARQSLAYAQVRIEVSGEPAVLIHRPYQMPLVVNGIRIYIESTRCWAIEAELETMPDLQKAVRFSAQDASQPWGPQDLVFPVRDYRWRSSPYNNTWSALVPYNLLYYHRGEDYGAIPDHLDMAAIRSGRVIHSPISTPSSSNCLTILSPDRMAITYCHMNIETINRNLITGHEEIAGEILGKTGETWNGYHSQDWDPHLHVGFDDHRQIINVGRRAQNLYSPYPFLVDAYLRDYPDAVLAVAGGHSYAIPGESVTLDATRSVARLDEVIARYTWKLSNGEEIQSPIIQTRYGTPGLYAEELVVTTSSGAQDRDYALVRVYNPIYPQETGCGFCYHTPVRGIHPGTPVSFWNRLQQNIRPPVWIDFGDGTPREIIKRDCTHAYLRSGCFTVSLCGQCNHDHEINLKMKVTVD